MTDIATRPAPPPLEYRTPLCSVCGEATRADADGFECLPCGASWSEQYWRSGSWDNKTVERCPEGIRPYEDNSWVPADAPHKRRSYQCFRDAGHEGEHANPEMTCWAKGWA